LVNNFRYHFKEALKALLKTEGLDLRSRFVETSGPVKKVHYLEYGNGPPLLFLHGGGINSSVWFNIIRELQDHFHLYLIDRPGCGLTDPFNYKEVDLTSHASDFLCSVMDALGLNQAALAGGSFGGFFISQMAIRFPDRVNKLIFLGAPTGLENQALISRKLLSVKSIRTFVDTTLKKPTINGGAKMYKNVLVHDASLLPAELYQCYYQGNLIPGSESSFRSLALNMVAFNGNGFIKKKYWFNEELTTIDKPVLFLWGDKDFFAPPELGVKAAKNMKNARIKIFPDAGHAPWLDKPMPCIENIIDFMG